MTHSNCRNIEPLILLMASIGGLDQSNEIENEIHFFFYSWPHFTWTHWCIPHQCCQVKVPLESIRKMPRHPFIMMSKSMRMKGITGRGIGHSPTRTFLGVLGN